MNGDSYCLKQNKHRSRSILDETQLARHPKPDRKMPKGIPGEAFFCPRRLMHYCSGVDSWPRLAA